MRRLLAFGLLLALAVPVLLGDTHRVVAAPVSQELANEVYFHETGHHISGAFLQFWLQSGGLKSFGYPLTEQFEAHGTLTQYFERARFEYRSHRDGVFHVELAHLGRELAGDRTEGAFAPFPSDARFTDDANRRYFSDTGHFASNGFKAFWEQNGGLSVFGYPISEEFVEDGLLVQYFERARFEFHSGRAGAPDAVQLGRIGETVARAAGQGMAAIARKSTASPWPNVFRNPAKWIEVDLGQPHTLTAWEGDTPILTTYVSGGTDKTPTVTGWFEIYWKLPSQDLTGGLAGTDDFYNLPGVPYVMYFFQDYAIHSAYWHSNWGYPMSHGCVNMRTSDAEWLYNWATFDTMVWVHD